MACLIPEPFRAHSSKVLDLSLWLPTSRQAAWLSTSLAQHSKQTMVSLPLDL